jgi:hypothetical protein
MITKIYRYRLKPGAWDSFVELQKRADTLYLKHVSYDVSFVRNLTDPQEITEIHIYKDINVANKANALNEVEPELSKLFSEFVQLLDPDHPEVKETQGETKKIR